MSEKFGAVPGVYLLLENELNEVLFLRRKGTNYLSGMLMTPGGGVEPGERPKLAAIREAAEEVIINVSEDDLVFEHAMYRAPHDETGERLDIFLSAKTWQGTPVIGEPHKCEELLWLPIDNLPNDVPSYVRTAIKLSRQEIRYSEFDWDL